MKAILQEVWDFFKPSWGLVFLFLVLGVGDLLVEDYLGFGISAFVALLNAACRLSQSRASQQATG